MAVCICCLCEVEFYTTANDNTNLCDFCRDEGKAKIVGNEVIIISDIDPPKRKRRGRPKGAKDINKRIITKKREVRNGVNMYKVPGL